MKGVGNEVAGACEHHKYVADSQLRTNQRLEKLEQAQAQSTTLISTMCNKLDKLSDAIEKLADSIEGKIDALDRRIGVIEQEDGRKDERIKDNEDTIKEMRGWIVGAASTLLITALGWLIWYLQAHYSVKAADLWMLQYIEEGALRIICMK